MKIVKRTLLGIVLMMISTIAFPQQLKLGKNPYTIEKSAVLELQSDNQGLLFPRIADTSLINLLSPSDGMVIFHAPSKKLMLRTNGYWAPLVPSSSLADFWSVNGNSNGITKKVGNTDNYDLSFITSNTDRLRISATGNVGINNPSPAQKLDVTGNFQLSGAFMPNNNPGTAGYVLTSGGAGAAPLWISLGLANLSDATISAPANGEILRYNGTKWINFAPDYLSSIDTNNISNFYLKVRSELSAGSGINYNAATGAISSSINIRGFWNIVGNSNTNPATNFLGTADAQPLIFKTDNIERMQITETGNIGIGSSAFDGLSPEKLLVDAGITTSTNLVHAMGSINNLLRLNLLNQSNGANASTDLMATANNGNNSLNFIDMGINSGGFANASRPILNGANNGYLYSTGNDLVIGNATANKPIRLFTGGYANANERMRIDGTGNIGINNQAPTEKLDVTGNLRFSGALMPNNSAGTSGNYLRSNGSGAAPTWVNLNTYFWRPGGNTVSSVRTIGTVDNFELPFITNNTEKMRISTAGYVGIGTTSPSTFLHIRSGIAGDAGLRFENLTSASTATAGVATLGVDVNGKVVRAKTPTYYSGGIGGSATVDEITKIWVAEVANTSSGIQTITIPANVGFTNIISIQVTAKGGTLPANAPVVTITSNTTSSVDIRVMDSRASGEGLEAHVFTSTIIYIRVEGN